MECFLFSKTAGNLQYHLSFSFTASFKYFPVALSAVAESSSVVFLLVWGYWVIAERSLVEELVPEHPVGQMLSAYQAHRDGPQGTCVPVRKQPNEDNKEGGCRLQSCLVGWLVVFISFVEMSFVCLSTCSLEVCSDLPACATIIRCHCYLCSPQKTPCSSMVLPHPSLFPLQS